MDKRGISEIVSYVLLIVLAISLSLLVYAWMKSYIPRQSPECPDNVRLAVIDYYCENHKITINLKNNGNFDIDGFVARYSNSTDIGLYSGLGDSEGNFFNNGRIALAVRKNQSFVFDYTNNIYSIEILPLKIIKNELVVCSKALAKTNIENC